MRTFTDLRADAPAIADHLERRTTSRSPGAPVRERVRRGASGHSEDLVAPAAEQPAGIPVASLRCCA